LRGRQIGRAAADRVAPGSVVGLIAGTTTTEVSRALAVMDSSKFGVSCLATMCRLDEIDTVITDEGARHHHETIDALQQAAVELVIG
jgi:DeoR/GlpR family transcriptional regulator of sugar metabolism